MKIVADGPWYSLYEVFGAALGVSEYDGAEISGSEDAYKVPRKHWKIGRYFCTRCRTQ